MFYTVLLLAMIPLAEMPADGAPGRGLGELSVGTVDVWSLRIFPHGGGMVGFGCSFEHWTDFPAGTIDFQAAVTALRRTTREHGCISRDCSVAFCREGSHSTIAVYTRDSDTVLELFRKAVAAAPSRYGIRTKHFDKLWETRPPQPCPP